MYIKLYIIFCSGFKSLAILILVLLCMFENAKHQKGLKTLTILDKLDLGYCETPCYPNCYWLSILISILLKNKVFDSESYRSFLGTDNVLQNILFY